MPTIKYFTHSDKEYRHDYSEFYGTVTLKDENSNNLLRFHSDRRVEDLSSGTSKHIGRMAAIDDYWEFRSEVYGVLKTEFFIDDVEGYTNAEIEVSKAWLDKQL